MYAIYCSLHILLVKLSIVLFSRILSVCRQNSPLTTSLHARDRDTDRQNDNGFVRKI